MIDLTRLGIKPKSTAPQGGRFYLCCFQKTRKSHCKFCPSMITTSWSGRRICGGVVLDCTKVVFSLKRTMHTDSASPERFRATQTYFPASLGPARLILTAATPAHMFSVITLMTNRQEKKFSLLGHNCSVHSNATSAMQPQLFGALECNLRYAATTVRCTRTQPPLCSHNCSVHSNATSAMQPQLFGALERNLRYAVDSTHHSRTRFPRLKH